MRTASCLRGPGGVVVLCLVTLLIASSQAWAWSIPNQEVEAFRVLPSTIVLRGPDAVQQLLVERGSEADGWTDGTFEAEYLSTDPQVATVDEHGFIEAVGEGASTIAIRLDGVETAVSVSVEQIDDPPPLNFANDVVPLFTKMGCNGGGCHGKSGGQNGFRLGLLGFEPELDYQTLVKEGRGRRLFPAAPELSLLLRKGTGEAPHGGGKRMEIGSHEYRVIERWIAMGMPRGLETDPKVEAIRITPAERMLQQKQGQQLQVTAIYSDGSTEDVTAWAQYESNASEVASVAEAGRVTAGDLPGQAAIMARYQGQVAVFNAKVPQPEPAAIAAFEPRNALDEAALAHWQSLGIAPSEPSGNAEFLRRARLDITGTLPTVEEIRAFEADPSPDKRDRLIDELLESPEYATYFAIKWADILRNKRQGDRERQNGTFRFYSWIRTSLLRNTPYDQFVREILAASGTPETTPPVMWYRNLNKPDEFVDDTAQVFLGMRLQCAKCHHHPFERWGQDDYYSFAAFFGQVGRKNSPMAQQRGRREQVIYHRGTGAVRHPKTNQVMAPRGLGESDPTAIGDWQDPRDALVDWLSTPGNPFFARALVNRYWAHFFSRGIVEPLDDLRLTNPPSNPALLDALVSEFERSGYDLKALIRTICTSQLYGLSSVPNKSNARDTQSFARYYPKRMGAEVLVDAISRVTGRAEQFGGFPQGTRAIELPDESVPSTFLDTFGRPQRDTACECERSDQASLSQSLLLLNSEQIQSKLTHERGRVAQLIDDPRPDAEKLTELFLMAFAREPASFELDVALEHIEQRAESKQQAYEDIIWALVNAKEFQFID